MFPNVKSENGAEAVGDGIIGAGVLADGQCSGSICLEPDPAGAKKGGTFLDEVGFKGVEGPPLFKDLGGKGRFLDSGCAFARNDSRGAFASNAIGSAFARNGPSRSELVKVEIVIQDLAGVVENGTAGMADDLLQ